MSEIVTILAGGFSASKIDLTRLPGTVIAVNDAAYYSARWDICLSMDRLWAVNRRQWIALQQKPIWLRRAACERYEWARNNANVFLFNNSHVATVLTDEVGALNGTHSGFCALNLGYSLRPKELYLVGFDMALGPRGERHWYPDYAWSKSTGAGRLGEWSTQFDHAAKQLRAEGVTVYLVGSSLPVKHWHQMSRETFEQQCAA